jgi:CRP/FNR family cyclic AMP-dependent transcriptional regulator
MSKSSRSDISNLLGNSRLLESLPPDDLAEIVSRVRQYDLVAGEMVFSKGAPGSYVYWVESGRLRQTLTSLGGGEILHSMVEVGDDCGILSVLDREFRVVNAIADRRTHLIGLEGRVLLPVLERNPRVCMDIARVLCETIRVAGHSIENLGLNNSEARIWSRLIHLSNRYGELDDKKKSIRIVHGLSQQDLADSVGLTRVMVNRQLRIWRKAGLTEDGRGFVVILDPPALESYVWRQPTSK